MNDDLRDQIRPALAPCQHFAGACAGRGPVWAPERGLIPRGFGGGHGIAVAGDYAYIADPGLTIVDIGSPSAPVMVHQDAGPANDVYLVGSTAYLIGPGEGSTGYLAVIDVSDPTDGSLEYSIQTPGVGLRMFVSNDYAYLATAAEGDAGRLTVIDLTP